MKYCIYAVFCPFRRTTSHLNHFRRDRQRHLRTRLYATVWLALVVLPSARSADVEWINLLGTPDYNTEAGVSAISADQFGVVITGSTFGNLAGPNAGFSDYFIRRYDVDGQLQWTQQGGTALADVARGVSVDVFGSAYIVGNIGTLIPTPFSTLPFLNRYGLNGDLVWSTTGSLDAQFQAVSADELGGVYVAGHTSGPNIDGFLHKYGAGGGLLWTRPLATPQTDIASAVATDGLGNVYVGGYTQGDLGSVSQGSRDAFVSKYAATGQFLWTRQFGTSELEEVRGISADSLGNVFVTYAGNELRQSITKFNTNGIQQWTLDYGPFSGLLQGASADGAGNVYAVGVVGNASFVRKYDSNGDQIWNKAFEFEDISSVSSFIGANVYFAGNTPQYGSGDGFLGRLTDFPPRPPAAFTEVIVSEGFDSYVDTSFVVSSDGTAVTLIPDDEGGRAVRYSYNPTSGGFLARGFDFVPVMQPGAGGANTSERLSDYRVTFDLTIDSDYIPANGFEVWLIDPLGQGDTEGDPSASLYSVSLESFSPGVRSTVSFTLDESINDRPFGYSNGSGFKPRADLIQIRLNGLDFSSPPGIPFAFSVDNFSIKMAPTLVPEPSAVQLIAALVLVASCQGRPRTSGRKLGD